MIQQDRMPRRFGTHASAIQLLASFIASSTLDGGITDGACTLASLLFWASSASLLWWHEGRTSRLELFFLRWGLLAFVLIGTPLLRAVVERWGWLLPLLYPGLAALIVVPLMYLFTRVFGLHSPFDGTPPPDRPTGAL
jgi:hypothetical protein